MTSKIKVDNINKVSDDSNIINKCGTTVTVGAASDGVRTGADNLQAADGGNLISQSGTTITLGASGDTITLAAGASQTGFGREGSVDWQTTPKTATFTAANGEGYFVNSGSALTMNLPAGSPGAIVAVADYARNFSTYNLTIAANGSELIGGDSNDAKLSANGQAATLVYVDGTKGWVNVQNADDTFTGAAPFPIASGGNAVVTCGNFKTHIFTSPGTFAVSNIAPGPSGNPNKADYFIVAGGGSNDIPYSGGGGAGGFRISNHPGSGIPAPTMSPLVTTTALDLTASSFPITVGAGGAAPAGAGGTSTFSTITSAGGGNGASNQSAPTAGVPGGSGGSGRCGGAGNVPPVSPPQGNNAGNSSPGVNAQGGGGGAASAGGTGGPPSTNAGGGGAGSYLADAFVGPTAPSYGTPGPVSSTRYFAGGGGGGSDVNNPTNAGGVGGGGDGRPPAPATDKAGTINTGGGAGGTPGGDFNGGSGIVMIRYKFQ